MFTCVQYSTSCVLSVSKMILYLLASEVKDPGLIGLLYIIVQELNEMHTQHTHMHAHTHEYRHKHTHTWVCLKVVRPGA